MSAVWGQRVVFECQATGWYPEPSLTWQVNSRKVDDGQYNVSAGVAADGLYNRTSALGMQALESSHVECLASVSALPTPLASRVRLTVCKNTHTRVQKHTHSHTHTATAIHN